MKDSDKTFLIAFVFVFLSFAADLAAVVGNISLAVWAAFEGLFCVPLMITIFALSIAWDNIESGRVL